MCMGVHVSACLGPGARLPVCMQALWGREAGCGQGQARHYWASGSGEEGKRATPREQLFRWGRKGLVDFPPFFRVSCLGAKLKGPKARRAMSGRPTLCGCLPLVAPRVGGSVFLRDSLQGR